MSIEQLQVEYLPIDALKPSPYNPRVFPDDMMDKLVKGLREFGCVDPIIVNKRTGNVVGGHMRLEAARKIGMAELPVVHVDVGKRKEKALNLALNKVHGDWDFTKLADLMIDLDCGDFDMDLTGFGEAEREEIANWTPDGKTGIPEGADDVPEVIETDIKRGDIITLGRHRLMCGDATSAEDMGRLMGGALADCVFTSPPYGLGVDYGSYKDTIANLRSMLPVLADNWKRVLVMGGFAVINFGDIAGGREPAGCDEPCEYPMAVEYWPVFRRAGWRLWTRRVWCKPNPRVHAPWTIQSNRAATDFEHIWTWVLPGKPLFWKTGASARQGWFDTTKDHGVDVKRNVHAAGMAVGCAVRMVQIHCRGSKNVYEPFCGTGTTLIAAELTGRTCYGMEIEPKYCEVACQRWEKLTGEGRKQ